MSKPTATATARNSWIYRLRSCINTHKHNYHTVNTRRDCCCNCCCEWLHGPKGVHPPKTRMQTASPPVRSGIWPTYFRSSFTAHAYLHRAHLCYIFVYSSRTVRTGYLHVYSFSCLSIVLYIFNTLLWHCIELYRIFFTFFCTFVRLPHSH